MCLYTSQDNPGSMEMRVKAFYAHQNKPPRFTHFLSNSLMSSLCPAPVLKKGPLSFHDCFLPPHHLLCLSRTIRRTPLFTPLRSLHNTKCTFVCFTSARFFPISDPSSGSCGQYPHFLPHACLLTSKT